MAFRQRRPIPCHSRRDFGFLTLFTCSCQSNGRFGASGSDRGTTCVVWFAVRLLSGQDGTEQTSAIARCQMLRSTVITLAVSLVAGIAPACAQSQQPESPATIVQAQVDAFNRGDANAFASFYADDVELFDLGPETKPSLSGRAGLLARYTPMLSKYHPKATIISRIENGNFIIDKERTEARGRSSEGVAIYQIENGKIRRVWFTP